MSFFDSPVCMCFLYIHEATIWLFLIRQSRLCHCPPFRMYILILLISVYMAYDIYLSSSPFPTVSIVISWLLVFQSIVFRVYLTFVAAVILILKHATFLQLSASFGSALTQSELDYQQANINLIVQKHLSSPKQDYVAFIMGTKIGSSILASVLIVSHSAFSAISVFTCIA